MPPLNGAFYLGVHGAACGLFLLIACLAWRDRRSDVAGRLGAALAVSAAAGAVTSVPGFHDGVAAWQMPIMVLSWGSPVTFWLWARANFDDSFVLRRWHALPWVALVGCGYLLINARLVWPAGAIVLAAVWPLLALGFALLTVVQTLVTWPADLVANRRRLRAVVLFGTVAFMVINALANLASAPVPLAGPAFEPIGLFLLAALAAWGLLRISGNEPETVSSPAVNAARAASRAASSVLPALDRDLLRRLEQLMTVDRAYRQEGLTIGTLATRLKVPEHRLRQTINEGLGHRNFNAFLNHYRIEEARAALVDPGQNQVPVLTIALDTGFQSVGPFNRAFKTSTGMTPTDYRSRARARHSLGPDPAQKIGNRWPDREIGQPNPESGEMKPGIS
jgi:AraC-like DNA-binding protein